MKRITCGTEDLKGVPNGGNDKVQCVIGNPRTGRQGEDGTCLGLM